MAFMVEYRDGLRGSVILVPVIGDFNCAVRVRGRAEIPSFLAYIPWENSNNFSCLVHYAERFFESGRLDWPIERYLPSLVFGRAEELRVAAVWLVALAAMLALHALAARRPWADRAFASGALPIVLALAIGVMVDDWARPGSTSEAPQGAIGAPD